MMTIKEQKTHIWEYLQSIESAKVLQEVEELLANAMQKELESTRNSLFEKYATPIQEHTNWEELMEAQKPNYERFREGAMKHQFFKETPKEELLKMLNR